MKAKLLGSAGLFALIAAPTTMLATPALAQDAAAASTRETGDIIVTARKREETAIAVPVAITAIGQQELSNRAINTMDSLARAVPSLIVGEGGGTVQGGIIAIRGLSGADSNPFADQAVSFNIDGVQVARASVRRMSEMDIAQVEVLKGPQALFFGKNSPAGIISVRTNDPTYNFQAGLSTGYELKADEIRTQGYISGPLTENLGFRIAGYFSDMQGYSRNVAPRSGPGIFPTQHSRAPNTTEYAVRGTLKWEPTDAFSARLKLAYADVDGTSSAANTQIVACARGFPQDPTSPRGPQGSGAAEDCRADDRVTVGDLGPNFGKRDARFRDGVTFLKQHQILGGLELNYELSDALTLTSVTGFYKMKLRNLANFTANYQETGIRPKAILASFNFLDIRETTEELRLTSNYDGPVNFMIGGLYQDSHAVNGSVTYFNALAPIYVNNYRLIQNGIAYSVFGQALINILPTLELAVGGRYSYERKKLPVFTTGGGGGALNPGTLVEIDGIERTASFNNLSPEATLSFRPSNDLTVYGSYKEGFLSGGYNSVTPGTTTPNPLPGTGRFLTTQNPQYNQQLTRGFEGGVKAALLGGDLRTNFSLYSYRTTGLQVSVTVEGVLQELRNAGSVRTKGFEFDFSYRTPLEGLTLTGAVNYNRGRYLDYQASCYRGQSSDTCFLQRNRVTGKDALLQDLSGTQLVRAPQWTGNLGFNFETPIGTGLKLGLSGNGSHSDGYFTDTISAPGGRQRGYELFDASIRLGADDDTWEVALIGRNLTDKFYFVRSSDIPFTGSNPGCSPARAGSPANCTSADVASPVLGDTAASVSRGRELMLRLSYKFGG